MNATQRIAYPLATVLFLLCRSAAPAPPVPYQMIVSVNDDRNSSGLITLNVINPTQHTLGFAWVPGIEPVMDFKVEFRELSDGFDPDSGWMCLKPNPKPALKPGTSDIVGVAIEHREKICILPGQNALFRVTPNFPMSTPGFYRVSLTTTLDAYELDGPVTASAKVRSVKVVLHGGPIVLCKTSSGFF